MNHKVQQELVKGLQFHMRKQVLLKTPAIAFGRSISGIDYESLDGQPAHLFFYDCGK
ncbi:hypothetical protein GCM10020331_056800 [Ectobacillus funiculus]